VEADALRALDSAGVRVVEALKHEKNAPRQSHATPPLFVCEGGLSCWLKRQAQQGLVAELVAGRLGALTGASANAVVVRVQEPALPIGPDGSRLLTSHLGLNVGSEDLPETENFRYLQERGVQWLDPAALDVGSRARVLLFQSWLGVSDTQILVRLTTGELFSLDHGEWGADPTSRTQPTIVETPGVPVDFARERSTIEPELRRVEAISDEHLLRAVGCVPDELGWNAAFDRRFAIAGWLAWRRDQLRGVVEQWWTP
jgi:hypothetical protein